jgi:hypothetical protein
MSMRLAKSILCLSLLLSSFARGTQAADLPAAIRTLVDHWFVECHGAELKEGNLDLQSLTSVPFSTAFGDFDQCCDVLSIAHCKRTSPVSRFLCSSSPLLACERAF